MKICEPIERKKKQFISRRLKICDPFETLCYATEPIKIGARRCWQLSKL